MKGPPPDDLELLVRQAEGGDAQALEQLRQELSSGRLDVYMSRVGDLARHAEAALLDVATGEKRLMREGIQRQMEAMRRELAGSAASPLERLMVERLVICWAWANYLDSVCVQLFTKPPDTDFGEFMTCLQTRAHRRFLDAARTLAQIRRLKFPAVQLNVAERQINVTG